MANKNKVRFSRNRVPICDGRWLATGAFFVREVSQCGEYGAVGEDFGTGGLGGGNSRSCRLSTTGSRLRISPGYFVGIWWVDPRIILGIFDDGRRYLSAVGRSSVGGNLGDQYMNFQVYPEDAWLLDPWHVRTAIDLIVTIQKPIWSTCTISY